MYYATVFSELSAKVRTLNPRKTSGRVSKTLGMKIEVQGLQKEVAVGDKCVVHARRGEIMGEIVDSGEAGAVVLPFGTWDGVSVGDEVTTVASSEFIYPHESWVGRVLNAFGQPIDGQGHMHSGHRGMLYRTSSSNAYDRKRVGPKLETGVKVLDLFAPICQGQRMGVFASSGVGKSSMISMLARNTDADVIVIGLIGERGREVQEFIQDDLGEEGMKRCVMVVSTSDESPLMRRQAAWTSMTVAEYFRDQGKQVLLLMDSVTRFAMAQREIGLSAGEPPTSKGYPPTTFAELPRLLERAGPGVQGAGDITGVFTILVDGDDHDEPIADAVRGITDGHIVLDRKIAESGRYPAVNVLRSVSRMLPDCHTEAEYLVMSEARSLISRYEEMEDMIRIGAYKKGADPQTDAGIIFNDSAPAFLSQKKSERVDCQEAFAEVYHMLTDAGVKIKLPAA